MSWQGQSCGSIRQQEMCRMAANIHMTETTEKRVAECFLFRHRWLEDDTIFRFRDSSRPTAEAKAEYFRVRVYSQMELVASVWRCKTRTNSSVAKCQLAY